MGSAIPLRSAVFPVERPLRAGVRYGERFARVWLACWALAAGIVWLRRLAGHLDHRLSGAGLIAALGAVLLGIQAVRWLAPLSSKQSTIGRGRLTWLIALVSAGWLGVLLTGQPVGVWLSAGLALVAITWGEFYAARRWSVDSASNRSQPMQVDSVATLARWFAAHRPPAQRRRPRPSLTLRQELVRGQAPDGVDVLQGRVREAFTAGQRTAVVHVAFCPPFVAPPQLTVRQTSGPPAQVRVGPLWAHGARLEVKLRRAAPQAIAVGLSLSARFRGPTGAAEKPVERR